MLTPTCAPQSHVKNTLILLRDEMSTANNTIDPLFCAHPSLKSSVRHWAQTGEHTIPSAGFKAAIFVRPFILGKLQNSLCYQER